MIQVRWNQIWNQTAIKCHRTSPPCVFQVPPPLWAHHLIERRGIDHQLQEDLGQLLQVSQQLLDLDRELPDLTNWSQLRQHDGLTFDPVQSQLSETLGSVHQRHQEALEVLQQIPHQLQDPTQTHLQGTETVSGFMLKLLCPSAPVEPG